MTAVLVVAAEPVETPLLDDALRQDGFEVTHATASQVASATVRPPDVVLASALLGAERILAVRHHLASAEGWPTVLVFADDEPQAAEALEACVAEGFEYLTPPFRRGLLRHRVSVCSERFHLTSTLERMRAEASLLEYERDLSIAHRIQSGFLPDTLPSRPGWGFAARFRPAKEVAGDFYDGFELVRGSRVAFIVADVCDKGVGAALFMALIRTLLRHTAEHTGGDVGVAVDDLTTPVIDPDAATTQAPPDGEPVGPRPRPLAWSVGAGPLLAAVIATNRYMARNHLQQGYFATVFFGVLDPDTGSLVYVNGGHNPPVLTRADGRRTLLHPTGPAVGITTDGSFALGHTTLDVGDNLLLYTDGVCEARSPGGAELGMGPLMEAAADTVDRDPELLLDRLDRALERHVDTAEQFDDITMLAVTRRH